MSFDWSCREKGALAVLGLGVTGSVLSVFSMYYFSGLGIPAATKWNPFVDALVIPYG